MKDVYDEDIIIRKMADDDIPMHNKALTDEYGPVSKNNVNMLKAFKTWDEEAWLTAEVKGNPVGFISCNRFDDEYAMIGFYIVLPEYRGQGIGKKLWTAVMGLCGNRNVFVNAVTPDNYKKRGITQTEFKYHGCIGPAKGPEGVNLIPALPEGLSMRIYSDEYFSKVLLYDTEVCRGKSRNAFLRQFIKPDHSTTYVVFNTRDAVVGYGTIHPVDTGVGSHLIAPLYADSDAIAESLLVQLLTIPPKGIHVGYDAICSNPASLELTRKYDLGVIEEVYSVFTRPVDYEESLKAFALSSACISFI